MSHVTVNLMKHYKSVTLIVLVIGVVVVAANAWVHHYNLPHIAAENQVSSTAVATTTTTAAQPPNTTPSTTVASSTSPSTSSDFIDSLETCSKGSGAIAGQTDLSDNGSPTVIISYYTEVNVVGVTNQGCVFTVGSPRVTSFIETALGKAQATAPTAQAEAEVRASMSQAPLATCTVSQATIASVSATFSDPTKFDAFLNSSACGS
jgi:hypothetical protein